jgi:hypothetical protein
MDTTRYFCTYFDHYYLSRGLALHYSLMQHCPSFKLWVVCLSTECYDTLKELDLPNLIPISQAEFEHGDEKLVAAKENRSKIEYYFTCTPSLALYVLNHFPEVDLITYLDSDLFFFSNPQPIFDEMGNGSIAIIPHRFSKYLKRYERNGIYNVGWVSFRRDINGIACLQWWREKCIEWCYDKIEPDRFADQKYLNYWEEMFEGVVVIQHKGANLAAWNISSYNLQFREGNVLIDNQFLIFFHFNSFKKVTSIMYTSSMKHYLSVVTPLIRQRIFDPYIKILELFKIHDNLFNGVRKNNQLKIFQSIPVFTKSLMLAILSIITLDFFLSSSNDD